MTWGAACNRAVRNYMELGHDGRFTFRGEEYRFLPDHPEPFLPVDHSAAMDDAVIDALIEENDLRQQEAAASDWEFAR